MPRFNHSTPRLNRTPRLHRTLTMVLMACATLMLASTVMARPGGKKGRHGKRGGGHMMSPKHFDKLADELALDPALKAALTAQLEAARAAGKEKKAALRAEHEKMQVLMKVDVPDRAAVMAQLDRIGALRLEMHKLKVGTMIDLKAALSPEQRALLKTKMQARRERRGKRGRKGKRGRRGDRGEPGFEPGGEE